jgi:hypothetical protein
MQGEHASVGAGKKREARLIKELDNKKGQKETPYLHKHDLLGTEDDLDNPNLVIPTIDPDLHQRRIHSQRDVAPGVKARPGKAKAA